ncbi:MAG TPA: hypothetical protein VHL79_22085 [Ramlibacter sp.]|jgi:hypothetical protein|nr:hypothetical protein [Ramlibacter sp.]
MARALSESLGWLKRQVLSYLLIVAILLAGGWLLDEYRRASVLTRDIEQADASLQQERARVVRSQERVAIADRALSVQLAAMRKAREALQQQALQKEQERDLHRQQHWPWAGLHGPEALAQSRLLDEQVRALQEGERIAQQQVDATEAMQKSALGLAQVQAQARGKRAEADRLRAEWRRLSADHPVAQRMPWSPVGAELDRLKNDVERLQQEAVQAERIVGAASRSREVAEWLRERSTLTSAEAALQEAQARRADLVQALEGNAYHAWRQRLHGWFADKQRVFVLALLLLVGAIVSRLAIKALLYYVVAPFASRRRPIRLLHPHEQRAFAQAVAQGRDGRISAESLTLRLTPDEELLVRPEYIQSSSEHAAKRTAWLLDASLPFTSILSGMYLLTRVRSERDDPIVLSPAQDPFEEVCQVELPAGATLVCQPRALAGVVRQRRQALRASRHWRLGSLHAWLTLQLRFLVFHGPCRLVLKGGRGVRMEAAGGGRLINQSATLAFDASVPYSNVRTETFVPYWLGKEGLFNDRFSGIDGSYLYEERSLDRRGNPLVGRGLEGLCDGVLRVFGI